MVGGVTFGDWLFDNGLFDFVESDNLESIRRLTKKSFAFKYSKEKSSYVLEQWSILNLTLPTAFLI